MNANEINLMNYKLIYEHLVDKAESMSTNYAKLEWYTDACQRRDKARHLYIRKMIEFLENEQQISEKAGHVHLDLDFDIDAESYLLTT